jgi:flagellar basal-body rod protein FlgF
MDRLIYVAMTGARESMRAQSVVSHNIANAGTIGFRALQHSLQSAPVPGWGFPSRINAVSEPNLVDTSTGVMISTGRNLDIAIRGQGWLAVQAPDGEEAYTRGGNLRVTPEGMLETANGHLVLGNGGPISLPPYQKLAIGGDGQISIVPQGQKPDTIADVDRLKLVKPDSADLKPLGDGLFRLKDGEPPAADPSVLIASGQLETSNVNPAQALVQMIELSRHYEMQVRAMHNAEQNDQAAARLMRMNG